jgi:hypothetical protein
MQSAIFEEQRSRQHLRRELMKRTPDLRGSMLATARERREVV